MVPGSFILGNETEFLLFNIRKNGDIFNKSLLSC